MLKTSYIYLTTMVLLSASCSDNSKQSAQSKEYEAEQERKENEIRNTLSGYEKVISLKEIEWKSSWLIEKQNYFQAQKDTVFYLTGSSSSMNLKKVNGKQIVVIAGDLDFEDIQVRAVSSPSRAVSFSLPTDQFEWDDEWLLAFKVRSVTQPVFHIKSKVDGVSYVVEEEDLGNEVYSEIYLEGSNSTILVGELIEFKKIK